jgi:D-sedoheptulose 7-phosphate isomerase
VPSAAKHISHIRSLFDDSIAVKQRIIEAHLEVIVRMSEALAGALQQGGKVLLCGNGGSAADAQHLAAELLVRLRPEVDRGGLPALSLATDTSSLTACGNDFAFESYYERLVRALGKPHDILIGLTTSGDSTNIVRALRAARDLQIVTLGLLGGDGGAARAECDLALVVPSNVTGRVQEAHITIGHALMELTEEMLLERGYFENRHNTV